MLIPKKVKHPAPKLAYARLVRGESGKNRLNLVFKVNTIYVNS